MASVAAARVTEALLPAALHVLVGCARVLADSKPLAPALALIVAFVTVEVGPGGES